MAWYLYIFYVALPSYQLILLLQSTCLILSKLLPFLCAYVNIYLRHWLFTCQNIIILPVLFYSHAFLLPLYYMAEYPEVIRVQSHFVVQIYLDATRLRDWDACPYPFSVDSEALSETNQLHIWIFNLYSTEPLDPNLQWAVIRKLYSFTLHQWPGVSNTKCVPGRNVSTTEFWMTRVMESLCPRIKPANQANQASYREISHALFQPVKKTRWSSPTYQIASSYLPSLCRKY